MAKLCGGKIATRKPVPRTNVPGVAALLQELLHHSQRNLKANSYLFPRAFLNRKQLRDFLRPAAAGADPARIEASRVAKGKRWKCTVTPSDGTATGPAASGTVTVLNSPPGPAIVRLRPAALRDGEAIRCEIVAKSEDPDGDSIRYRYAWQRNGAAQPFADTSQEVPPRLVKAGDRWRCTVTPTDGSEDGPTSGTEEAVITGGSAERSAGLP